MSGREKGIAVCDPGSPQKKKNVWVNLQAALGKKEEELVELREQHDQLISRSRDALHNWESAMQAKDHVIQHLQHALRAQLSALERQEKINEDARQRLMEKEQVDKDKGVVSPKSKTGESLQQLSELRTTVSSLKGQLKDGCNLLQISNKTEVLKRKVSSLEKALHSKEKECRQQEVCCKELTVALQRKEYLLQLAQSSLQSILSRQDASSEVLEYLKRKIEQDRSFSERIVFEFKDEISVSPKGRSSNSPKRDFRPESNQESDRFMRPKQKSSTKVDEIIQRIRDSKGRNRALESSPVSSEHDDMSHGDCPYFWLRNENSQEDLTPLLDEIERLEENWKRTEARMRAELSRRVASTT